MKVGSCYSGIGGSDCGLVAAGWQIAWQAECDPFRQSVLRRRFGVPVYATVDMARVRAEPVDAIYGALPDQRLAQWWPDLLCLSRALTPAWLVCEFSPTILCEQLLRDVALDGWRFRLVFTETLLRLNGGAWDSRKVACLLASRESTRLERLQLSSMVTQIAIDGLTSAAPIGTPEWLEAGRGLRDGWTCLCDSRPCRCDGMARERAINDATPPFLTQWLAELIDVG